MADQWVANGWFGTGLVFQRAFVPTGSTITLTYNVTDKNGKILVGQDVKLRVNKGYSVSTAIVQVDEKITTGVHRPESADQAQVTHKTDAYGNVTFVMKNLDKPGTGEPEPESMTAKPVPRSEGSIPRMMPRTPRGEFFATAFLVRGDGLVDGATRAPPLR
jgi:hypothetical protein